MGLQGSLRSPCRRGRGRCRPRISFFPRRHGPRRRQEEGCLWLHLGHLGHLRFPGLPSRCRRGLLLRECTRFRVRPLNATRPRRLVRVDEAVVLRGPMRLCSRRSGALGPMPVHPRNRRWGAVLRSPRRRLVAEEALLSRRRQGVSARLRCSLPRFPSRLRVRQRLSRGLPSSWGRGADRGREFLWPRGGRRFPSRRIEISEMVLLFP